MALATCAYIGVLSHVLAKIGDALPPIELAPNLPFEPLEKPALVLTSSRAWANVPQPLPIDDATEAPPVERASLLCSPAGAFSCGACVRHADCGEGRACAADLRTRAMVCVSSDCESDDECESGRCLTVGYSTVTRCRPLGEKELDDECSARDGCVGGLVCAFGVCRPPCNLGDTCTNGTCIASNEGLACVVPPTVDGVNCSSPDACPPGEECITQGFGHSWTGSCQKSCPCPSDESCGSHGFTVGLCFRTCSPRNPWTCGDGHVCSNLDDQATVWGCIPSGA